VGRLNLDNLTSVALVKTIRLYVLKFIDSEEHPVIVEVRQVFEENVEGSEEWKVVRCSPHNALHTEDMEAEAIAFVKSFLRKKTGSTVV
jgi:hypothetical protein